jgi:iron complex transport system substrate-binding protein
VPLIGNPASGEFSVEKAISLNPDVVLLNLDAYQGAQEAGLIVQLDKAGIPTVVIDFRQYPLENTVPSALLMGKLFGKEAQAQKFSDFYLKQINSVYARLDQIGDQGKPTAFLFRAAGFGDCCGTFGSGNLGLFIERAGGINLGSELLPGWSGTLNPETVVSSDIDLIIVTGSNWKEALPDGGYVSLGYATDPAESRQQLTDLMESRGWTDLPSVQNGRVYAIWHQFYNSPYNFIALQQIAKWLYPDAFDDLDPVETFKDLHH